MLELSESYSDNITLAPSGQEESDFVTQINPSISLHGEGARLSFNAAYRLQNLLYASNRQDNSTHQQLAANGNAELLENFFFVDAHSSMGQQITNANGRLPLDNVNIGNRSDYATYGLSPYFKFRIGSYADTELRYEIDQVDNQSSLAADAESQRYLFHMNSGSKFSRFLWDLNYQKRILNQHNGNDSRYENGQAGIRYHLFSAWNLLARGGFENNDISTRTNYSNGAYWGAGLEWAPSRHIKASVISGYRYWNAELVLQPSERTALEAGYVDQKVGLVSGPSWHASLTHRTRRTTWVASYSESSTNYQILQITGQQFYQLVDNNGNVIVDPNTGLPIILVQNVFGLTNENFIRQRGQGSVTLHTGKSDVVLALYDENRKYELSQFSEESLGADTSWTWHLSARTSTLLGGGWQRRNPINTKDHDDLWYGNIALNRAISRDVDTSIQYRHMRRETAVVNSTYDENRVTLQLTMRF